MKKLLGTAIVFAMLVVPMFAAAPPRQRPTRIMSVIEKGSDVSLELEGGKTVLVPAKLLRVHDRRAKEMTIGVRRGQSSMTAAQVAANPAVATVFYRPDGTVRRVRVDVFATDADAADFARRSASAQ